ncbi:hypothetical protein IFM89_011594 [Coptis chinensis]|uniref:WAT1-related protein n=1 Tax=Coptis chinensis TaxID=261450 RepID=A0A835H3M7_9MAGN|nr:hypothetical protein IFM89_011594 [Coptis chinensis]
MVIIGLACLDELISIQVRIIIGFGKVGMSGFDELKFMFGLQLQSSSSRAAPDVNMLNSVHEDSAKRDMHEELIIPDNNIIVEYRRFGRTYNWKQSYLSTTVDAMDGKTRPPLPFTTIMKIFVLASLGSTLNLNLYYAGLKYTSPTVATALTNVTYSWSHILNRSFTPGSALVLASNAAWSAWFILQALICKDYPANLSLNTLICFFASLQSTVLGFILDRQATSWKLGWNVQLFTIVYCGLVNSALVYFLQTWCLNEKGQVFAAMFSPLLLIIIAIFSAIAFAERLHVGSFIGSVIIIFGLYCVLWGKSEDGSVEKEPESKESSLNTQKLEIILDCELAIEHKTSEEKDRPALLSSGSLSKQSLFSKM